MFMSSDVLAAQLDNLFCLLHKVFLQERLLPRIAPGRVLLQE